MRLSVPRVCTTLALLLFTSLVHHNANAQVGSGAVAYNGGATEDFDTLASTGTSSALPQGWYFYEAGGASTTTYQADDGSLNGGNVHSYGSSSSSDRAFGILASNAMGSSGTVAARIGAQLNNETGATLTSLSVAFNTELWLYQGAVADLLAFEYSTDATSLTSGTWTAVTSLDAVTPTVTGTGAKDGNLPANRTAVAATISSISVASGANLWLRWSDTNISGTDNGLAIDDVVFGVPVDNLPTVTSTTPTNGASSVAIDASLGVSFSEPVTNSGAFSLSCMAAGSIALTVTGGPVDFTLTPDTNLNYSDDCELQISGANIQDQDGTLDNMAGNVSVLFLTEADASPQLTSSTPADMASDFPVNGNLTLLFSEPVTLGANWFQIVCSVSGNRSPANVVVSGGPDSYSLDPASDFIAGENCTMTLDTSAITDQGGSANTLIDPGSIAFVPVADAPPAVLSTTPMDGDSNFPSAGDIVVLFSEPVTLSAGAFILTCDTSSGISLSHAMTGTSFTIDTGTALVAGDACTFTIDRTKVVDGGGLSPTIDEVVNFTVATSSIGTYYDTVNDSSPEQLRCTLHDIIKGHTIYPYGWIQLEVADEAPPDVCAAGSASSENFILDVYRNRCYAKVTDRSGSTDSAHYNREHVWPKSLGFNNSSLAPYSDLHMLHLSASDHNSDRGNKPYDDCDVGCTRDGTDANNGVGGTMADGDANWFDASVFEVWDQQKGDMARTIFYMAIRYEGIAGEDAHDGDVPDLELTDNSGQIGITSNTASTAYMGLLSTLLAWNTQDPVDDRERDRNVVVYSFQGNRNPFIDHPEWATMALFTSSQPATCMPNVGAVNANDDSYIANEDTTLIVAAPGVLGNDTTDTSITGVSVTSNVAHGALTLNNDGSFEYIPSGNYCGADSFIYEATDGADTDTAIVSLAVACQEDGDAPAQDDSLTTDEDTAGTVNVIANDGVDPDPEQNPPSIAMVSGVSHGATSIVAGGIEYTPDADYCGNDSFSYTLTGGGSATVNVSVTCINDAPTVVADSYGATEDQTLVIAAPGVLDNDSDVEMDSIVSVTVDADVMHGVLTLNNDGSFSYQPTANYCGPDSFSYIASDGNAQNPDSAPATVTLDVGCVNDAPTAVADSYAATEGMLLTVAANGVLGNDSDVEDDALTAVLDANVSNGTLSLNSNGGFTYQPTGTFCGDDGFTYHANDGQTDSATVAVTITVGCVNNAPVAVANSYFGSEDSPVDVAAPGILGNDSDADMDTLTAVLDVDVTHGSLTLNADGSFSYVPDANYCGGDSFMYHATDDVADSGVALVSLTIGCLNDAPTAAADSYAGTQGNELLVVAPGVLDNDSDIEGNILTAELATGPASGTLDLGADGNFTYTPNAGFCGNDSFSYRANDGEDLSAAAIVSLQIACTGPTIFVDGFE